MAGAAALYAVLIYDYSLAAADLDAQIKRARSFGLPLEPRDLVPRVAVANDENAAEFFHAAERLSRTDRLGLKSLDDAYKLVQVGDDLEFEAARARLVEGRTFLDLADRAAARPRCDFGRDWDKAASLPLPELGPAVRMAKGMCARAVVSAVHGTADRALSELAKADRIGAHMGSEPALISGLVESSIRSAVLRTSEAVATLWQDAPNKLKSLRSFVGGLAPLLPFEGRLRGEAFLTYHTARNFVRFDPVMFGVASSAGRGAFDWPIFPPLLGRAFVCRAYAARTLEFWNDAYERAGESGWKAFELSPTLDRLAARFAAGGRPSDALNGRLIPAIGAVGRALVRARAHRTCVLALIDSIAFSQRSGRFPSSLREAGVEALDPFDDAPLRFRSMRHGFRIYSVGDDGRDDGGKASWSQVGTGAPDRDMVAYFPAWRRERA